METSIGCCCFRRRRRLDEDTLEALEVDGSAREDGTSSWCSSKEEKVLAKRFGESTTAAERRRFFIYKGSHVKKASAALESYVKRRPTLELSSSSSSPSSSSSSFSSSAGLDPFAALSSHGRPMPSTTVSFVEHPKKSVIPPLSLASPSSKLRAEVLEMLWPLVSHKRRFPKSTYNWCY